MWGYVVSAGRENGRADHTWPHMVVFSPRIWLVLGARVDRAGWYRGEGVARSAHDPQVRELLHHGTADVQRGTAVRGRRGPQKGHRTRTFAPKGAEPWGGAPGTAPGLPQQWWDDSGIDPYAVADTVNSSDEALTRPPLGNHGDGSISQRYRAVHHE
jgi:hypothetical protein